MTFYNILIVDDSVPDINCIEFLIKKYNLPLYTYTAGNGKEAFELIENGFHCDILFTDVCMPFMDGLKLTEAVLNISPNTKIIIFSGFSEFEYAKTAIKLGVQNYLMKPIIPADFVDTIQKVIHFIESESFITEMRQLSKNHFLYQLIQQDTLSVKLSELQKTYFCLMLLECSNDFFHAEDTSFSQKITEFLPFSFDYLNLTQTRSLLFVKESYTEDILQSAAQHICWYIDETYNQMCYIAIGSINDHNTIRQVYLDLEKRMEKRFFFPNRNILSSYNENESNGHINIEILIDDLKRKDYDFFFLHLDEILNSMLDKQTYSLIYVKYSFTELTKIIMQNSNLADADMNLIAEKIYNSDNILELRDMIHGLVNQIISKERVSVTKTEKIKQYIYQHYAEPITLSEIASHFYISSNYLCSLFKKETGYNLTKFINDYRLKRASELLLTTEMKIQDIASSTGFNNVSYFCQLFRNSYGETPEIYRQIKRRIP